MKLAFCEKCYQMTNHNSNGKCLKCRNEYEKSPLEKAKEELKREQTLHTLAVARFRAGEKVIYCKVGTFEYGENFNKLQDAIAAYDAAVNKPEGEGK